MDRINGCLLLWKCLVARLFLDESQQATLPHSKQSRRWTHRSPILTHSSQTRLSVLEIFIWLRWVQEVAIDIP